jgi:hypothetical protein
MSLRYIKADVASVIGVDLSNTNEAAMLLHKINKAAYEVYTAVDLVGSLFETLVSFNADSHRISLPSCVDAIRGLRWYQTPYTITLNDIRPHYQNSGWGIQSLNFREVGRLPLSEQITNESTLRFRLPKVESRPIVLTVAGSSENSDYLTETLTIPAGQLEVESAENYLEVKSLRKDAISRYNITVLDAADTELGIIPNNKLFNECLIVQVLPDSFSSMNMSTAVEVLFKYKWFPFSNDDDEFICTGYDDIIALKTLEWHYLNLKDSKEISDAYKQKAAELATQRFQDDSRGKELLIEYGSNKFLGLHKR